MARSSLILTGLAALTWGSAAYGHVNSNYSCSNCHTSTTGRASVVSSLTTNATNDPGVVAGIPKFQVVAGASVAIPLNVTNGATQYSPVIGGWTSATTDSGALNAGNVLTFTPDSTYTARTSGGYAANKGLLTFSSAITQTYTMAVAGTSAADYYAMDLKVTGKDSSMWTQAFPIYVQVLSQYTYAVNADGNINTATNFSPNGIPTGNSGRVLFGSAITAARTVNINTNVSFATLAFDNATSPYTLAGTSTITLQGDPATSAVRVLSGNHVVACPVLVLTDTKFDVASSSSLTFTGNVNAAGRTLTKLGLGTLNLPATSLNVVAVNAGTLKTTGTANTVVTGATVSAGAALNIATSPLIVNYTTGASPLATLLAYRGDGRLTSSSLGAAGAIGWIDTASTPSLTTYNGTALDTSALVIVATLKGDSNLDKSVSFDDLLALAQNYGTASGAIWSQGDADYNGSVSFDDLLALAQNYGASALADGSVAVNSALAAQFDADWKLAQSLVPEPSSLLLLASAGAWMRRRR